jgi:glucose/arabinose dehydrogenase/mono/diheme cytochrome c family protein
MRWIHAVSFAAIATFALPVGNALAQAAPGAQPAAKCSSDPGGIVVPPGFCATVFADKIGHVRHMVVSPDGVVYADTWSGTYYNNDTPHEGGFLVALKDTKGDGHADVNVRFGDTFAMGDHGGTGIAIYKDGLYAEMNDRIIRYALDKGDVAPKGKPETIVSGLPLTGDHPMHPMAIDGNGNMYVDVGTATNACQDKNRIPVSPGHNPCVELQTRGGTWLYDANKTDQHFSPAERFVTGLRNGEGISFDSSGRIFATQHGRDQLAENWPKLYEPEAGHNLPAEELVQLVKGGDYGWPECYFDNAQQQLVLAPEYGGDGGRKVGVCATKREPVAFFPAHWAPNDMLIYNGTQFPLPYRGGAFIAFHGSWNRAPAPQGGYNVVFQPLHDGQAAGTYVVFADGFAGAYKEPGRAAHRPTGLAVGPDGALYIADDKNGRVWRITYVGSQDVKSIHAAAEPGEDGTGVASATVLPPEGIHADAGDDLANLPVPPGATKAEIDLGSQVFHGQAGGATCAGCHGSDAKGTSMGADLTSGKWQWGDGGLQAITHTIVAGVPVPKSHTGGMPPLGGTALSDTNLNAVAAYVWAVGHQQR